MFTPPIYTERRHPTRPINEHGGWVGIDRGLAAFAVAATLDGVEVGRWVAPRPLTRRLGRLRRRSRNLSRTKRGSQHRVKAARDLSRQHAQIADARQSFLHEVSSQLAKTHGRLAIEDLAVANLVRNRHLARAISDAGWAELGRQLRYKAGWFGAELVVCDRWFASTRTCSRCGMINKGLRLAERVFHCGVCGLAMDRDRNAAANLAAWAEAASIAAARALDRQAGGRVTNAPGGEGTGRHLGDGATGLIEGGTDTRATTVRVKDTRGGWRASTSSGLFDAL
jgi:putative transposase